MNAEKTTSEANNSRGYYKPLDYTRGQEFGFSFLLSHLFASALSSSAVYLRYFLFPLSPLADHIYSIIVALTFSGYLSFITAYLIILIWFQLLSLELDSVISQGMSSLADKQKKIDEVLELSYEITLGGGAFGNCLVKLIIFYCICYTQSSFC